MKGRWREPAVGGGREQRETLKIDLGPRPHKMADVKEQRGEHMCCLSAGTVESPLCPPTLARCTAQSSLNIC